MECIEREISKTPLYSLLGADGIDELKHKVIDIICDVVKSDLKGSRYYLISPEDVNRTIGIKIIDEAVEELKEEYKKIIKDDMSSKLDEMLGRK